MRTIYFLSGLLILFFTSCSNAPGVKVVSSEYVETINMGATAVNFEGNKILTLVLDFQFTDDLAPDFEVNTDEHRAQVYKKIVENTHFYINNKEVMAQYGYWPEKSGTNFAKSLTLFYLVPEDQLNSNLLFTCDGSNLGDEDFTFSQKIKN